ncbi:hypothetical protein Bca52824_035264 [Brassica carinata]|uniref:Uncharacterized protein n=1 Tax=Brassica carinata TaxID=52824 RepID=A0A8X7S2U1_BRACI|nr:hypothetical protein Bca52824_035264 [Brassica carinata]
MLKRVVTLVTRQPASPSDPTAVSTVPAHIVEFLSFQSELECSEAGEAANHAPNASPRPTPTSVVPTPAVAAEGVVVVDTLMPETELPIPMRPRRGDALGIPRLVLRVVQG